MLYVITVLLSFLSAHSFFSGSALQFEGRKERKEEKKCARRRKRESNPFSGAEEMAGAASLATGIDVLAHSSVRATDHCQFAERRSVFACTAFGAVEGLPRRRRTRGRTTLSSFSLSHSSSSSSAASAASASFSRRRLRCEAVQSVGVSVAGRNSSAEGKVVVIDNYDSFTYNLCQYLGDLGCSYEVYRNDEITIEELKEKNPRGILISPGPGIPQDSGISLQSILQLGSDVPIFGVCMGLQCMGEAYGGKIVRSPNGVVHGKTSPVYYDEKEEDGLLAGLPNPFTACRYHSLVIERETFPSDQLEITAWTEDGLIMGVRHRHHKHVQGVQFHPESIITKEGKRIVANFLSIMEKKWGLGREKHAAAPANFTTTA